MKKKPALQKILDDLDQYSIEELENIPGQPLWIRTELVALKDNKTNKISDADASLLAMKMDPEFNDENPVRIYDKYEVREWIGDIWHMPSGINGSWKIQIENNDKFLILEPKKAKIQSTISNMNWQQWNYFLQLTKHIGYMNINEFLEYISNNAPTFYKEDPNVKDMGLFKIIKHSQE